MDKRTDQILSLKGYPEEGKLILPNTVFELSLQDVTASVSFQRLLGEKKLREVHLHIFFS